MSKFSTIAVGAAIALFGFSTAGAGELLLTSSTAKSARGGSYIALDLATDGNVSGFNFLIRVPGASEMKINLSNCLSELPKGFSGDCRVGKEGVYVFAMADDRSTLKAGMTAIGTISGPALAEKSASFKVEQLVLSDADGEAVTSRSQIAK
jgi:hypothetical protein